MLSKAKQKIDCYITNKRAVMKQHFLPTIPFPDNDFDVVFFSHVLHHLDKDDSEYLNAKGAIKEAYRALKPGGMLMIITFTQKQMLHSFWFYSLLHRIMDKIRQKFIPENDLLSFIEETGFRNRSSFISYDEILISEDVYKKLDGPLDANWRKLLSIWAYAEKEGELQYAIDLLNKLKAEGNLESFFEEAEQKRMQVGGYFTVFAQKPI